MALATYSDLKTAIANHLARTDLTDQMDDFIDLAEARLGRELKTRSQESRTNITTTASIEFVALPTDMRRIRMVRITTDTPSVLQANTPNDLFSNFSNGEARPTNFAIIDDQIMLRPIPDTTYTIELTMSSGMNSLSDSNTTNTVLTRYPDAYLYGSLAPAYRYLLDETRASFYDGLTSTAILEINRSEDEAKFGSGTLQAQAQVVA
tara:strand:+ start:1728 stop:2348 length:621 start_codon:yes stop_codon:yes gene_type:complete